MELLRCGVVQRFERGSKNGSKSVSWIWVHLEGWHQRVFLLESCRYISVEFVLVILHVNRLACHPDGDNFNGSSAQDVRIVHREASELTRRIHNIMHRSGMWERSGGDLEGCALFLFYDIASCWASNYAFLSNLFRQWFRGVFLELSSTWH